jgi:hypothetical protein
LFDQKLAQQPNFQGIWKLFLPTVLMLYSSRTVLLILPSFSLIATRTISLVRLVISRQLLYAYPMLGLLLSVSKDLSNPPSLCSTATSSVSSMIVTSSLTIQLFTRSHLKNTFFLPISSTLSTLVGINTLMGAMRTSLYPLSIL